MELRGKGWHRTLGGASQRSMSCCPTPGRALCKGRWSTRDLPRGHLPEERVGQQCVSTQLQLGQSRHPVSHGGAGSRGFLLLTRQPRLGMGGREACRALPPPAPRPWQLLHAGVSLQRGQLRGDPWSWALQTGGGLPPASVLRGKHREKETIPTRSLSFFFTIFTPVNSRTKPRSRECNPHLSEVMRR